MGQFLSNLITPLAAGVQAYHHTIGSTHTGGSRCSKSLVGEMQRGGVRDTTKEEVYFPASSVLRRNLAFRHIIRRGEGTCLQDHFRFVCRNKRVVCMEGRE